VLAAASFIATFRADFNGAEAITPRLPHRFRRVFRPYGVFTQQCQDVCFSPLFHVAASRRQYYLTLYLPTLSDLILPE
jgi:hypothetical protein